MELYAEAQRLGSRGARDRLQKLQATPAAPAHGKK
jgi:hypothetical protein